MDHPERSVFIFDLVKELDISLVQDSLFEDELLISFINKYQEMAAKRDAALARYLQSNPSMFRCYIPYSRKVFVLASQIVWYQDEIIIRDPIIGIFKDVTPDNYETIKKILRNILDVLYTFSDVIISGYLLLAGEKIVSPMPDKIPPKITDLMKNNELVSELDRSVSYGIQKKYDTQNRGWLHYQASLESGMLMGMQPEVPFSLGSGESTTSPEILIGEQLPEISLEEISKILHPDAFDRVRSIYPREIYRTIHSTGVASSISSAIIFDRYVDALILSVADSPPYDEKKQVRSVGSFNLSLPYIDGVSPEKLIDLRNKMPEAFLEFRALMAEIVDEAMKDDPAHATEIATLAMQQKIYPMLRKLEAEIDATTKKMRLIGIGLPVSSALGTLIGATLGVNLQTLLPILPALGAGMVAGSLTVISEYAKAKSNPVWFLWQARRK